VLSEAEGVAVGSDVNLRCWLLPLKCDFMAVAFTMNSIKRRRRTISIIERLVEGEWPLDAEAVARE
jgi:hypothetical protein